MSAPRDVSTLILSKIDAATSKTLDSTLATSWLVELDQTIQATKEMIHERIQRDRQTFDRQLASAQSVQTRFGTLTTQITILEDTVSNPETGLIPTLVENLTKHAKLEQEALDSRVEFESLSHLLQLKKSLTSIESLVNEGKLADAVHACHKLDCLFNEIPTFLNETRVVRDLRDRFRRAQSRNEEQLSDAYSRAIVISQDGLIISQCVQVRRSITSLSLPSILSSLSGKFLASHLTTLRRDLTSHFIDDSLKQSKSIAVSSTDDNASLVFSSSDEHLGTHLENLSALVMFLSSYFFPSLPSSDRDAFPRSLCKPITTSILNNVLIPSLPSSFGGLPEFLGLVDQCVAFEKSHVVDILGGDSNSRPVKAWADGLVGHYERQRRFCILDRARNLIVSEELLTDVFSVEVEVAKEVVLPTPTITDGELSTIPMENGGAHPSDDVKEDAWGFDDAEESETRDSFAVEEDSWGLDETLESTEISSVPAPETAKPELTHHPSPEALSTSSPEVLNDKDEPDPSMAWGWNEEESTDTLTEETAWDDPWANDLVDDSSTVDVPPAPSVVPKAATRLEKLANKSKKQSNNSIPTPPLPPETHSSPQSNAKLPSKPVIPASSSGKHPLPAPPREDSRLRPASKVIQKESFYVSLRMKHIIPLVEEVLNEGRQFSLSTLFPSSPSSSSTPGTTILLSAPAILDLYRALYPVKFARKLALPADGMRFSNDCLYLSREVERIQQGLSKSVADVVQDRFSECGRYFWVLSESWYHDVLRQRQESIDELLRTGAQGFTYIGDQDRYDECEAAVMQTLQEIRRFSQGIKGVLTKSKHYTALGTVVNAALSRILVDVLALPDIPEVESHQLSELCKILHAIQGLFVEDPAESSFIAAYVPLWFKFSYLSELLEASMADITYLFEVGALVDFQIDELVGLVRALFSDTPLRTSTINKLLQGHPVPSSS